MSDCDRVYPFPGKGHSLFLIIEEPDFDVVTRTALDAVDVLRPVWEPLSVEASLFALEGDDPETASLVDVVRPHRLLVKAQVADSVLLGATKIDPVITTAGELSRLAIDTWLENALHDVVAGDGQYGEWSQLRFDASRAWGGPAGWRSGESELRLDHDLGAVVVPIERAPSGAWLSGPREPASDQPPVAVRITNRMGRITLRLTRHYGYWLEPSEPAAQRLDALIDQLRAMGWQNES